MLCDRVASGNDSISRHDGERVDAFETMVKLGSFTKIRCRECGECIDRDVVYSVQCVGHR
jgi:hypothetical protein